MSILQQIIETNSGNPLQCEDCGFKAPELKWFIYGGKRVLLCADPKACSKRCKENQTP